MPIKYNIIIINRYIKLMQEKKYRINNENYLY